MRRLALLPLLLLASSLTGCMVRPNAGAGFDEPGYHPHRKVGLYIPPESISTDGRVAALQVGLLLVAGVGADMRPGVGNTPAPHVPGKTGVLPGSVPVRTKSHPNAYLPSD